MPGATGKRGECELKDNIEQADSHSAPGGAAAPEDADVHGRAMRNLRAVLRDLAALNERIPIKP
jgi:hypothetical protein